MMCGFSMESRLLKYYKNNISIVLKTFKPTTVQQPKCVIGPWWVLKNLELMKSDDV